MLGWSWICSHNSKTSENPTWSFLIIKIDDDTTLGLVLEDIIISQLKVCRENFLTRWREVRGGVWAHFKQKKVEIFYGELMFC